MDKIEITPKFLADLKAKAEKAMPGPWELDETPTDIATYYEIYSTDWMVADCEKDGASAAFIAAANPQAILELIEAYERLETVINGYKVANDEAQEIIAELRAENSQLEKEADWLATFCVDLCPNVPYQVNCQSCDCCPGRIDCKDSGKPEAWREAARKYISGDDNA